MAHLADAVCRSAFRGLRFESRHRVSVLWWASRTSPRQSNACWSASAGDGQKRWQSSVKEPPAQKRPANIRTLDQGVSLSQDELLYLCKEAGIFTIAEIQQQIVRSPPFSRGERPFLLENFYQVGNLVDVQDDTGVDEAAQETSPTDRYEVDGGVDEAHYSVHGTIKKHFRPDQPATFSHAGKEWLSHAEGRGTRRRATAHAVLKRGSGIIKVNGEETLYSRWPWLYHRFDVCQPFKLTGTACAFDVFLDVKGGGQGGQAGAARLAVARALLMANPSCHDDLQKGFCLLEDTRQKLSKQPGRAGARKQFRWSKR